MSSFTSPALRSPEWILRAIMESASDAIMLKDLDGRVLLANQAAGLMLGCAPEDLIGRDLSWRFEPDAAAAVRRTDRLVLESGEQHTYESRGRTHDPGKVLLVTKTPWRD